MGKLRFHRYTTPEIAELSGAQGAWQIENWTRRKIILPWVAATGTGRSRNYNFLNLVEASIAVALARFKMPSAIIATATDDFRYFTSPTTVFRVSRIKDSKTGLWRPMTNDESADHATELARLTSSEQGERRDTLLRDYREYVDDTDHDPNRLLNQRARWRRFASPDTRGEPGVWLLCRSTEASRFDGGWEMFESGAALFNRPLPSLPR